MDRGEVAPPLPLLMTAMELLLGLLEATERTVPPRAPRRLLWVGAIRPAAWSQRRTTDATVVTASTVVIVATTTMALGRVTELLPLRGSSSVASNRRQPASAIPFVSPPVRRVR